jgi:hypothetical protein
MRIDLLDMANQDWTKFRTGTQLARIMFKQQHSQVIMKRILTKKIKEIIVLFILICDLLVSADSFTRLNKNNLPPHARAPGHEPVMFEPARHV